MTIHADLRSVPTPRGATPTRRRARFRRLFVEQLESRSLLAALATPSDDPLQDLLDISDDWSPPIERIGSEASGAELTPCDKTFALELLDLCFLNDSPTTVGPDDSQRTDFENSNDLEFSDDALTHPSGDGGVLSNASNGWSPSEAILPPPNQSLPNTSSPNDSPPNGSPTTIERRAELSVPGGDRPSAPRQYSTSASLGPNGSAPFGVPLIVSADSSHASLLSSAEPSLASRSAGQSELAGQFGSHLILDLHELPAAVAFGPAVSSVRAVRLTPPKSHDRADSLTGDRSPSTATDFADAGDAFSSESDRVVAASVVAGSLLRPWRLRKTSGSSDAFRREGLALHSSRTGLLTFAVPAPPSRDNSVSPRPVMAEAIRLSVSDESGRTEKTEE